MDPSKFPTDNLYKFMALCGLVLLIASAYADWQMSDRLSTYQWEEALTEHDKNFLMNSYEKEQNKEVKELYFKMFTSVNARGPHPHSSEAEDKKFIAELGRNRTMIRTGIVLGLLLTAIGFFLWYHKLQKHLDKAVAEGMKPA
jgi:hypothetical protein